MTLAPITRIVKLSSFVLKEEELVVVLEREFETSFQKTVKHFPLVPNEADSTVSRWQCLQQRSYWRRCDPQPRRTMRFSSLQYLYSTLWCSSRRRCPQRFRLLYQHDVCIWYVQLRLVRSHFLPISLLKCESNLRRILLDHSICLRYCSFWCSRRKQEGQALRLEWIGSQRRFVP